MDNRKCTKCEKKFPREELIKWHGGRYCDSCARQIDQANQITFGDVVKWGLVGIGIFSLIFWVIYLIYWCSTKKEKD